MSLPLVFAVSGVKNSGKTTLIERLIGAFRARGHAVAVIKHDGHRFSPDTVGTDSRRFYDAGAAASAVFDAEKLAVTCRGETDVERLIAALSELADVIVLEGFKSSAYRKVELVRSGNSDAPVCADAIAYVTDLPLRTEAPRFGFSEAEKLVDFLLEL
ncbi:MAG: molybdopterin-guanine dinucleotide biosynthesis protein B [Oscillibacter sp.]|nr:molybdopterin-guanine dinucleotide biosynthesis protein B [Oscillibacter sp.]